MLPELLFRHAGAEGREELGAGDGVEAGGARGELLQHAPARGAVDVAACNAELHRFDEVDGAADQAVAGGFELALRVALREG
eukprot:814434-Rhodomonas_salina.1